MNKRFDLHCHTSYSDGTDSPKALLALAKEKGLSGLSITDHDTIAAYNESTYAEAEKLGLELLIGCELSSQLDKVNVHVLAYDFISTPAFNTLLDQIQLQRNERNKQMIDKLKAKRIDISWEGLKTFYKDKIPHTFVLGRPHIAWYLFQKGITKTVQEAFDKYINDNGPCYVHGDKFDTQEIINHIHSAQGKAFIAHPHIIKNANIIKKLFTLDFDGVEGYYSRLPIQIEEKWIQKALDKQWLISGGSDYHGEIKPHIGLGSSWVDETHFRKIKTSH